MDEIISSDLHGRLGKISLPKGDVITPTLLPVIDPRKNLISAQEMKKKFDFNFVITSAYLYYKRYGMPNDSKTIHETLGFDGNIMMDSGAYQVLVYGDVDIDPIQSLQIQSNLKTDVGVILDVPTSPVDTFTQAKQKVEETVRRIGISLAHIEEHPETIWTLPIQGGKNTKLIEYYLNELKQKEYLSHFKFHALGSVAPIMSQYDFLSLFSMIKKSRELLPHNIPFHLFGAGHPMIFPFVVALGSDTFDSAAYILYAKENRYMTNTGTYHLHELYELPCNCEICSNWTPKELLDTDEDTRIRNIALHNLYVSHAELKRIRVSLKDGNLWELLVRRSKAHPSLYKAFKHLANGSDIGYLEYGTPITKQTGLKISGEDSFYRPEYSKGRKRIYARYTPNNSKIIFLISSGRNNPVELLNLRSELEDLIKSKTDEMDFAFLIPFFGLLPLELIETYPFSQYVFSAVLSEGLLENLKPEIEKFLEIFQYKEIVLCPLDTWENSEILIKHIKEILIRKNTSFKEKNFREL